MRLTVRLSRRFVPSQSVVRPISILQQRPVSAAPARPAPPVLKPRLLTTLRTMSSSAPTAAAAASGAAPAGGTTIEPQPGRKLYIAFMPDSEEEGTMAKRYSVRPRHFERFERMKREGVFVFGRGFIPPPSSPLHADPGVPQGGTALVGSVMILHADSLDEAWRVIREDVYWTEGVWDRAKGRVEEFITV